MYFLIQKSVSGIEMEEKYFSLHPIINIRQSDMFFGSPEEDISDSEITCENGCCE